MIIITFLPFQKSLDRASYPAIGDDYHYFLHFQKPLDRPSNPAIEAAAAEAASALDDNRQQLQNKLQELHQKKQKMDHLLQELQVLRSQRVEDIMNNGLQDNSK